MFPVYTGINRNMKKFNIGDEDVPCIHRDKPEIVTGGKLAK